MIASLPMYDWPEVREATDAWWHGLSRHLGLPVGLTRIADYAALWRDPSLVFSQTCGYPFTHDFRGRLKLLGTPHYDAEGCVGHRYCSIVFARAGTRIDDLRGGVAAFNNPDSMSGMLALQLVFAPLAKAGVFFAGTIETGGHRASLAAVRRGEADVCAIDAVCVAMARRHCPDELEGLVEIARSPLVPGLPYVTVAGDVARLREGLAAAFADPALREARAQLLLVGWSVLDPRDYDIIPDLEADMQKAGRLTLP
jgi:ABC-type phosphate/phosphonate transport system substrate-binding protein